MFSVVVQGLTDKYLLETDSANINTYGAAAFFMHSCLATEVRGAKGSTTTSSNDLKGALYFQNMPEYKTWKGAIKGYAKWLIDPTLCPTHDAELGGYQRTRTHATQ